MRRYNSIDLGKFIMSIVVVAIHTHPLENSNAPLLDKIYEIIVNCAVPFFFISTGFLLQNKMSQLKTEKERICILKQHTLKLVKLYLLWSFIYLPLAVYEYVRSGRSMLSCIISYVKWFFLVGEHYNSWILWYLLSSIYALLLYQLLYKLHLTLRAIMFIGFVFLLFSIFLDWLATADVTYYVALGILQDGLAHSILNGRILRGMFYIPLGMKLNLKRIPGIFNLGIMIVGGICASISSGIINNSALILCAIGTFNFIADIQVQDRTIYCKLRNMSTTIYFTHLYIWTGYYSLIYHQKSYGLDCFLITTVASILLAWGVEKYRNLVTGV